MFIILMYAIIFSIKRSRNLHIVVCIKQVADTNNVRWSKENNLLREGMLSILNPCDNWAIERALEIKKKFKNATVSVFSMGPMQAKNVVEYAIARGCDRGILLCDKAFAGSDTLSTGRILSSAIKKIVPDFNLIICGQYAQDGDTAQTGPTLAGFLNIPVVTCVDEIVNSDMKMSILKQNLAEGINIVEVQNPCVVCVLKGKGAIKPLCVADYVRAQDIGVEIFDIKKLGLNPSQTGILGSPTFVSKAFKLKHNRRQIAIENPKDFLCKIITSGGKIGE